MSAPDNPGDMSAPDDPRPASGRSDRSPQPDGTDREARPGRAVREPDPYEVRPGVPDPETFRRLRRCAGLSDRSAEAVALALPRTWYGVVLHRHGEPIGMGRIIGDGGTAFQITDVCVHPDHQGRGLGKRIMAALTGELERRAPATAYVSLIADGGARHLYAAFGFSPTAPASIGMARMF